MVKSRSDPKGAVGGALVMFFVVAALIFVFGSQIYTYLDNAWTSLVTAVVNFVYGIGLILVIIVVALFFGALFMKGNKK